MLVACCIITIDNFHYSPDKFRKSMDTMCRGGTT